jgi:hypothetical protein
MKSITIMTYSHVYFQIFIQQVEKHVKILKQFQIKKITQMMN